jgi:hypothetical protein
MGIRSDVAIAMKEYVYENLSPEVRKILEEWGFEEQSAYNQRMKDVSMTPEDCLTQR